MSKELKSVISDQLVGKTLQNISYYNINDNFFVFEEAEHALIDAGVTLHFDDWSFSMGWNPELELYSLTEKDVTLLFADSDYYEINKSNFPFVSGLIPSVIREVKTEWSWYHLLDENHEPTGPKQDLLLGLILEFESGKHLQLVIVNFELGENAASEFSYAGQGELLITTNSDIQIAPL